MVLFGLFLFSLTLIEVFSAEPELWQNADLFEKYYHRFVLNSLLTSLSFKEANYVFRIQAV